jgi:hypothetical protein
MGFAARHATPRPAFASGTKRLLIGGQWVSRRSSKRFPRSTRPRASGSRPLPRGERADIDEAVAGVTHTRGRVVALVTL